MRRTWWWVALPLGFVLVHCGANDDPLTDGTSPDDPLPSPTPSASTSSSSSSSSGAPPDAGADAESDAGSRGPLDPAYRHATRNYVLCTGQSLSIGSQGTPPLSTTQPYDNEMFTGGVVPAAGAALASFVPLVERARETMQSGFANRANELAAALLLERPETERSHRMLVSCHGQGGARYQVLKKGTARYQAGLAQLDAAVALSAAADESLVVRAVTNVHGESDERDGEDQNGFDYAAVLAEWQADLEADARARTGQTEPVPMFSSQLSSFTRYGAVVSPVALAQLRAHVSQPRVQILVGPKYIFPYADGVHLTARGYRWLGEYYAKAYAREILQGYPWEPLRPLAATRAGNVITVEFLVPAPPLVLDVETVGNPGNYGFTFAQDGAPAPAITEVTLRDATHVQITLASAPTGENQRVRYAFQAPLPALAGPTSGARGNLRDSDPTPSRHGETLYNWAVHFEQPVTAP